MKEPRSAFIYDYDNALLIRRTQRFPDGRELSRNTYEYDAEG